MNPEIDECVDIIGREIKKVFDGGATIRFNSINMKADIVPFNVLGTSSPPPFIPIPSYYDMSITAISKSMPIKDVHPFIDQQVRSRAYEVQGGVNIFHYNLMFRTDYLDDLLEFAKRQYEEEFLKDFEESDIG